MCVHSRVIEHLIVTLLQRGRKPNTHYAQYAVTIASHCWNSHCKVGGLRLWSGSDKMNGMDLTHTHTSIYITLWQEYNVLYKCVYSNNTCTYIYMYIYIYIHLYNTLYSCHLSALITPKRKQHFWSRKMKLYNGSDIIQYKQKNTRPNKEIRIVNNVTLAN